MLTSPSGPVRVSGAQGAVYEGDAAWAVRVARPVRHERPAVLDQLALEGVRRVVRRLEAGPVGGVRRPRRRSCPVRAAGSVGLCIRLRCDVCPTVSTPAGIQRRGDPSAIQRAGDASMSSVRSIRGV